MDSVSGVSTIGFFLEILRASFSFFGFIVMARRRYNIFHLELLEFIHFREILPPLRTLVVSFTFIEPLLLTMPSFNTIMVEAFVHFCGSSYVRLVFRLNAESIFRRTMTACATITQ